MHQSAVAVVAALIKKGEARQRAEIKSRKNNFFGDVLLCLSLSVTMKWEKFSGRPGKVQLQCKNKQLKHMSRPT